MISVRKRLETVVPLFKTKKPAASLFSRKQGLGVPIHTKMLFELINIHYTLLVLTRILYISYIALAAPGPCYRFYFPDLMPAPGGPPEPSKLHSMYAVRYGTVRNSIGTICTERAVLKMCTKCTDRTVDYVRIVRYLCTQVRMYRYLVTSTSKYTEYIS